MQAGPQIFNYSVKGRLKLAIWPILIGVLLLLAAFFAVERWSWKFFLLAAAALFLIIRGVAYVLRSSGDVVISDDRIERSARVAPFAGATVTLRTKKEGAVDVVLDVLVEGPPQKDGSIPSVVFDRTLLNFAGAVQAVLVHVPDDNIRVVSPGEPELTKEQKDAVLAPFRGNAVERALAQLRRPGALNIPPHMRN